MEGEHRILAASVELFRHYGFKTITMDDIARKAGISKKTLYLHFANKDEVVAQSVLWFKDRITEEVSHILDESDNAVHGMVRCLEKFEGMYKQINPLAMLELERFYPEAYDLFIKKLADQDVNAMKNNILQGKDEGLYREEIDAELMARFHIETSLMMCQKNLLMNDQYDLRHVSAQINEHFIYGILSPKGVKEYQKYKVKQLELR